MVSKKFVSLFLIFFLVITMILTNPTQEDFSIFLKGNIAQKNDDFLNLFAGVIISNYTRVKNYCVFSVYEIDGKKYFGVFKQFIPIVDIGKYNKEVNIVNKNSTDKNSTNKNNTDKNNTSKNENDSKPNDRDLFSENESKFVNKVRQQLGVPDTEKIVYKVGNGSTDKIVYITFYERGECVADATCDRFDASLVEGDLKKYSKPDFLYEYDDNVTYIKYQNGRFGFSLDVPEFFVGTVPPDNSGGLAFVNNEDDAEISTSGNYVYSSFDEAYNLMKSSLEYIPTYEYKGKNLVVFSGIDDDKIIYDKYMRKDGIETHFVIKHPVSLKEKYESIITHMSNSFSL